MVQQNTFAVISLIELHRLTYQAGGQLSDGNAIEAHPMHIGRVHDLRCHDDFCWSH